MPSINEIIKNCIDYKSQRQYERKIKYMICNGVDINYLREQRILKTNPGNPKRELFCMTCFESKKGNVDGDKLFFSDNSLFKRLRSYTKGVRYS